MNPCAIIISCEHAGNSLPGALPNALQKKLSASFAHSGDILASHRGWDAGALEAAQYIAQRWNAPLFVTAVSRLVCDTNRGLRHPALWSEFTNALSRDDKKILLEHVYKPHRTAIQNQITKYIAEGFTILHLAIHSFTPIMNGKVRDMDIGLLYDPRRTVEKELASLWRNEIMSADRDVRVRRNAPYTGVADGLPTYLRRLFLPHNYIGFEVEFNQALLELGAFPADLVGVALEAVKRRRMA